MTTPLGAQHDPRTGHKRAQVEGVVIEDALSLRVRRVVELEAAIEPEAIDHVGAHSAANRVGSLEDRDGHAEGLQTSRGGEPTEPCAYDHHRHGPHASRLWITESMRPAREGTMPA